MTLAFALRSPGPVTPEQIAAAAEAELPAGDIVRLSPVAYQLRLSDGLEVLSWWASEPIRVPDPTNPWCPEADIELPPSSNSGGWWTEVSVPYRCRSVATPLLRRLATSLGAHLEESET